MKHVFIFYFDIAFYIMKVYLLFREAELQTKG